MFPTICKIGPLSISEYGFFIAILVAIGTLIMIAFAFTIGIKRRAVAVILFWIITLAVVAMIPLVTTITIYSYGMMLAIGVVCATLLIVQDAHRYKIKPDTIFDLVFWVVIGGIVGARAFYVFLNYSFFEKHTNEIIMIQNGGLAWQGGLIVGIFTLILYIRTKKLSSTSILDLVVPYVALGQSFGRIGCFLNGCCYGKEVEWGVYFPVHDAHLHPTQLYLTAGYLLIFTILRRYQVTSQMPGFVFVLYLILASVLRFGVEFFRADHEIIFFGLSIFQFVSIGVLIIAFCTAYVLLIRDAMSDGI